MSKSLDEEAQRGLEQLLDIIAENVKTLMDEQFQDKPNRPLALGKESRVGKATVQRILKGRKEAPPNIKTLVALSWRFRVPLQHLLTDHSKVAVLLQPIDSGAAEVPSRTLKRARSRKSAE